MPFTDVLPTDWFFEYTHCLWCRGAISGYADHTFRPYNWTTRGQMTKVVVLAFGYQTHLPSAPTFNDVPTDHPFYQYVETAAFYDIVDGYDDGSFHPSNPVTRGQLCKITANGARWALINPQIPTFSDVPPGSAFYNYVETAYCHQIIDGYDGGVFLPYNWATRAQICKIVCQATRALASCVVP